MTPQRETPDRIGIGLAGLVNLLDPRLVVFGGLFGRIHPFVARIVEAELDRRALAAPRRLVRIVPSKLGVEASLRGANAKFERRFGHIEAALAARGRTPAQSTLEEMDALWNEAKAREKGG